MAYCFNCGHKISDGDVFCENCGTRLIDEQPILQCEKNQSEHKHCVKGVLYTNIQRLAEDLRCTCDEVEGVLDDYINVLHKFGVFYNLVSSILNSTDYNNYVEEVNDNIEPETKCLFVVGGSNVIPMPCVKNISGTDDKDVDTDLPYALLTPNISESAYCDGSIMTMDFRLDVGRFPTSKGSTIADLRNYLGNSIRAYEKTISIDSAYCQTNPLWNIETDIVAKDLRDSSLIHANNCNFNFCHNNMVTTPNVTDENVDWFINHNADLLLFNLHGSDSPGAPGFYGEDENGYPAGILPEHFASLSKPNVIVTEACYGARFDGFTKNSSMLLSALGNNTVGYLGSSRMAFGSGLGNPIESDYIDNADFISKFFIRNILSGSTLGKALNDARVAYQRRCDSFELTPYGITSFVEFNLFGDPAIPVDGGMANLKSGNFGVPYHKCHTKLIVSDVNNGGVLTAVRNAISRSRNEIHETMINKLYKEYGLDSKYLDSIKEVSCNADVTDKNFHYIYKKKIGDFKRYDIAITDSKCNVKRIITSK